MQAVEELCDWLRMEPQVAVQLLLLLFILEYGVGRIRGLPTVRTNDCLHSLSAALISALPRLFVTSLNTAVYSIVYHSVYSGSSPDDSSPLRNWCFVFLATDLGYYWFHRAAHEINLLWAAHQVHHSSEDFNMTVSLRQSVVQQFVTWIFYIPLAFIGIIPSTLETHLWFSCLYQIWTHTEVVDNLGPLEYIFVTPAHHRVHHGRNPYCIDKNYGGILIIWDRMFGTFKEEEKEDPPVFGLVVERVNHWNPLWTQISHYNHLVSTFWRTPGFSNKFSVLFKGPSWSPGKPRLGDGTYEEVEHPVIKYNRTLPLLIKLYVIGHFLLVLLVYHKHLEISQSCSVFQTIIVTAYLLLALTSFGTLFDHKWYAPIIEGTRCIIYLIMDSFNNKQRQTEPEFEQTVNGPKSGFIHSVFVISLAMWFAVEMMKINWTGAERTDHQAGMKYHEEEQPCTYDVNKNTIQDTADIIYLRYTK